MLWWEVFSGDEAPLGKHGLRSREEGISVAHVQASPGCSFLRTARKQAMASFFYLAYRNHKISAGLCRVLSWLWITTQQWGTQLRGACFEQLSHLCYLRLTRAACGRTRCFGTQLELLNNSFNNLLCILPVSQVFTLSGEFFFFITSWPLVLFHLGLVNLVYMWIQQNNARQCIFQCIVTAVISTRHIMPREVWSSKHAHGTSRNYLLLVQYDIHWSSEISVGLANSRMQK